MCVRLFAKGRDAGFCEEHLLTLDLLYSGHGAQTMLQHDHLGFPMFVHANLLKQIPSGVGRGFTWGRTRQTGLFNGGDPLVEGGEGSGDVDADSAFSRPALSACHAGIVRYHEADSHVPRAMGSDRQCAL